MHAHILDVHILPCSFISFTHYFIKFILKEQRNVWKTRKLQPTVPQSNYQCRLIVKKTYISRVRVKELAYSSLIKVNIE